MSEPKKENARLNHQQYYQLVQWLASNGEQLMKDRPTYTATCERAAKELGFKGVSPDHTLKQAMKQAGVHWEAGSSGRVYARITMADHDKMKAELATLQQSQAIVIRENKQLAADLAVLRALVHTLYQELDVSAPNGYIVPPKERAGYVLTAQEQR